MSGIGTRLLKLTIDGEEYTAQISTGKITSADAGSDFTTFDDAANGGRRQYQLVFTAVQDAATGTLWRQVWDHAGESLAFVLDPYGSGDTPSATQPQYIGTATVKEPDGDFIGGDANSSTTARMTISCAWDCEPTDASPTGKPVEVTDPDDLP